MQNKIKQKLVSLFAPVALALLFLSGFSGVAHAVTSAQLVAQFFNEDEVNLEIQAHNCGAYLTTDNTPLGLIVRSALRKALRGGGASSDMISRFCENIGSLSARGQLADFTFGSVPPKLSFVAALDVSRVINLAALAVAFADAEFELASPDGVDLIPIHSEHFDSLNGLDVYFAVLKLGDSTFLVAASDAAKLEAMASQPVTLPLLDESTPLECEITFPARIANLLAALSGGEDFRFRSPTFLRLEVSTAADSLRLNLSNNVEASLEDPSVILPYKARSRSRPVLVGGKQMLGLFSFTSLNWAMQLADMKDQIEELESLLSNVGLSLEDLADVLNGRVTLGISGSSSEIISMLPGIYLHLSGANEHTCDVLMNLASMAASSQSQIKFRDFHHGEWNGICTAPFSMVSAYAAKGDGFIIALQNADALNSTPTMVPWMEAELERDSIFSLVLDVEAITSSARALLGVAGMFASGNKNLPEAEDIIQQMETFKSINLNVNLDEIDLEFKVDLALFAKLLA